MGRTGAGGEGEGRVGAEGCAVGGGARAAGVGEDASVYGENVGHREESGGAGAEFGCEGCVSLGEFESLSDAGGGDERV